MPWKETSSVQERIQFVIECSIYPGSFASLCDKYGISRPTGYKWVQRFREGGSMAALEDHSRCPEHSPHETPQDIQQRVLSLRRQYGWGAKKIRVVLLREGIQLSVSTVHRIIQRHGLIDPDDAHRPATQRFERSKPNELWQVDAKGPIALGQGRCSILTIEDDHSRFAVGVYPVFDQRADSALACLVHAFEQYGVPEAMLMDHGPPWWSVTSDIGLSRVSIFLLQQDIRLYFCGIRHPQTQGKVERFHGTIDHLLRHRGTPRDMEACVAMMVAFRDEYNFIRPHEGIGMLVPADRYRPSKKRYNPDPPEWKYPSGMQTYELNSQGRLTYGSRRYFVCEALANQLVGVQELGGKVIVAFRNMYVREIDLTTGHTRSLVTPVTEGVSRMS